MSAGGGMNSKVLLASAPSARLDPSSRLSSAMSGSRELSSLLVRRFTVACFPPAPPPPAPPPPDAPLPPCASLPFPPAEEDELPALYEPLPLPPSSTDRDTR